MIRRLLIGLFGVLGYVIIMAAFWGSDHTTPVKLAFTGIVLLMTAFLIWLEGTTDA